MAHRFCPICHAEVEDVGGFCLLGHRFSPAPLASMTELRAEVERAFEDARVQVAAAMTMHPASGSPPPPPPSNTLRPADSAEPTESAQASVWAALEIPTEISKADPIQAFAPAPRMDWGPEKGHLLRRRARFNSENGKRPNEFHA